MIGADSWKRRTSAAASSQLGGTGERPRRAALDEAGDERALRLDEGHDLRTDAELGGPSRRLELVAPVDAEEIGVLARGPDDEAAAADVDPVVAVGDAALEWGDGPGLPRPARHPVQQVVDRGHLLTLPHLGRVCSTSWAMPLAQFGERGFGAPDILSPARPGGPGLRGGRQ